MVCHQTGWCSQSVWGFVSWCWPTVPREQRCSVPLHLQGGRHPWARLCIRCEHRLRGARSAFAVRLREPAGFTRAPVPTRLSGEGQGKQPISPFLPPKIVPHAHIVLVCLSAFSLRLSPCGHLVQFNGCAPGACCVSGSEQGRCTPTDLAGPLRPSSSRWGTLNGLMLV